MGDILFNNTFIVGAGGLGRELYSWINGSGKDSKFYEILGFIDDSLEALKGYEIGLDVLGDTKSILLKKNSRFLIAIANCKQKQVVYASIVGSENEILSYKHPSVILGDRVSLGKGAVLSPNVVISCDAKIGEVVFINCGSQIGHDVIVGDFTSIMASVNIGGGAKIGNNVLIGTGAVILPGVEVPDDTIIGAGSVVVRSVKKSGTYFGNPAKKIF